MAATFDTPGGAPRRADGVGPIAARWLMAGLLCFAFLCGFFQVSDVDPGFHIRTGELVLQSHRIPSQNTFSFTQPDAPWLLHQWAPSVVLYGVWSVFGVGGLIAFKAAFCAAIFWLACQAARQQAGLLPALWSASLAALAARERFFERPYLASAFLLAVLLFASLRWRGRRAWRWLGLPLLLIVWANTHAGVLYGVVYLGCAVLSEWVEYGRARRGQAPLADTLAAAVAVGLAVLSVQALNPSGARVLWLPITYTLDPFWHNLIAEFHPPGWRQDHLFFLCLAGGVAVTLAAWRRLTLPRLLPAAVFAVLALRSQRSILDVAIVSVPCVAEALHGWPGAGRTVWRKAALGLLPVFWVLAATAVILPDRLFVAGTGLRRQAYPMGIYRLMQTQLTPQPIFNDMRYGGGLLWFLYPQWRPFIDGRCEAYRREFWEHTYVPTVAGAGPWQEVLARYGVHAALLDYAFGQPLAGLAQALAADPAWAIVAMTDRTLLFLERTATNAGAIAKFEFLCLRPDDPGLAAITPARAAPALAEAMRLSALEPQGTFARTAVARSLMASGRYGEAVGVLEDLTRDRAAGSAYWRDYLYATFMRGDLEATSRIARRMIRDGHEPAFAWYIESFVAAQRGDAPTALEAARHSAALNPREALFTQRAQELAR